MHHAKSIFKCPFCEKKIINEEGGETVIRSRLLKTRKPNDDTTALCPRCKKEVKIPLKVTMN
jgi:endogenous inhibitor of DNA gyrase (YacG/DUF329 family)